jgi:hypothetical protein
LETNDALDSFDARAILATADAWKTPDIWQVYRAKSGYFWSRGVTALFTALLLSSMLIIRMVLITMFRTEIRIPWNEGGTYGVLLVAILMLLMVVYSWTDRINQLGQIRSAERKLLEPVLQNRHTTA